MPRTSAEDVGHTRVILPEPSPRTGTKYPYSGLYSLVPLNDAFFSISVPSNLIIGNFTRNLYWTEGFYTPYYYGIEQQYSLLRSSGWAPETIQYSYGIPPFGTLPDISEFIAQLPIWPPHTRSVTLHDIARGDITQYHTVKSLPCGCYQQQTKWRPS